MWRDKKTHGKTLDDQLDKTTSAHICYDEELVELKEIFYNKYDRSIVIGVLHLIQKIGHPIDQNQAEAFEEGYNADNIDETSIKWFKQAYTRYNEAFMKSLNSKEDVL